MILIDLQKTFDTLDHDFLLMKMHCIGFKKQANELLKPYLSKKKNFFVFLEGVFSEDSLIT